jgi:naphthoate synthase
LLSAEGPSSKDGVYSFVVVEIKMRGHQGYVGEDGQHRLNILSTTFNRFMVVIAVVPGVWAVGGGHSYMSFVI